MKRSINYDEKYVTQIYLTRTQNLYFSLDLFTNQNDVSIRCPHLLMKNAYRALKPFDWQLRTSVLCRNCWLEIREPNRVQHPKFIHKYRITFTIRLFRGTICHRIIIITDMFNICPSPFNCKLINYLNFVVFLFIFSFL